MQTLFEDSTGGETGRSQPDSMGAESENEEASEDLVDVESSGMSAIDVKPSVCETDGGISTTSIPHFGISTSGMRPVANQKFKTATEHTTFPSPCSSPRNTDETE